MLLDKYSYNHFSFQVTLHTIKYCSIQAKTIVSTEALVIQTKYPTERLAKEMINILYPYCFSGGIKMIPEGVKHKMGNDQYTQLLNLNNDVDNQTNCITVMAVTNI